MVDVIMLFVVLFMLLIMILILLIKIKNVFIDLFEIVIIDKKEEY